jgi:hypothetical protein
LGLTWPNGEVGLERGGLNERPGEWGRGERDSQ